MIREAIRHLGPCDLITITPPGQDRLRFDRSKCRHPEGERCSGSKGCRVRADDLADFHASFCDNLTLLLASARSALYRRGFRVPPYVLVLELQERGSLHVHVAVPVTHRTAGYLLAEYVNRYAPRYGFGMCDWEPARSKGENAPGLGSYISKLSRYVAKEAAGEANGLREVLEAVPGRRIFRVSQRITAETRCTMRNLRLVRFYFVACGRDVVPPPPVAERAYAWSSSWTAANPSCGPPDPHRALAAGYGVTSS